MNEHLLRYDFQCCSEYNFPMPTRYSRIVCRVINIFRGVCFSQHASRSVIGVFVDSSAAPAAPTSVGGAVYCESLRVGVGNVTSPDRPMVTPRSSWGMFVGRSCGRKELEVHRNDGSEIASMLAALAGTGPDMGFCGVTERESYGASDVPAAKTSPVLMEMARRSTLVYRSVSLSR